jgi:hypothetical protein
MAKSQKRSDKTQIDKFRDKARELECDEDEDRFKAALKTVASKRNNTTDTRK